MNLSDKKATLSFSDGSAPIEFPVYKGTVGPDVIDIRKLYGQTGMFTFDPGFMSTAACESGITYIDGDKGELLYRGYPIEQLAVNCDFMDICYLILNGELPNQEQKADFDSQVTHHTMVNEQLHFFLRGFRRDAHPMAVLTGLVGALSAFYHDSTDITNPQHRHIGHPPDRQDADAGCDGVQVLARPTVHLSAERPVLHGQLPAHDVRHAVRRLQGQRSC